MLTNAPALTTTAIHVFDDVLPDPHAYRANALALPFANVTLGSDVFRGIAVAPDDTLVQAIRAAWKPEARPSLSFFRKSPLGQDEPTFIHSDAAMGEWTAVLYLNPNPPAGDGTTFWRDRATDSIAGPFDPQAAAHQARWERWRHVDARFNRLLIFQADYYHSRGLFANHGTGDDARLTQVAFGTLASGCVIREATFADVPGVIAMAESFVAQTTYRGILTISPDRLATTLTWLLPSPDALVLVAEQDGRLVGLFALLAYQHHWSTDRVASELVWWMEPGYRGSAGARLLARGERWAREQGAVLQMIAPNTRLEAFYAKAGYTRVEVAYQKRWE